MSDTLGVDIVYEYGRHTFNVSGNLANSADIVGTAHMRRWLDSLDHGLTVKHVDIRATVAAPGGKILFVYLAATFADKFGRQMTHTVLLRGQGVLVLVVLVVEDQEYTVLVEQSRIAVGEHDCLELPGGTVEGDDFLSAAAGELLEEAGIKIQIADLADLTGYWGAQDGVYGSPGILEERTRIVSLTLNVSHGELGALRNRSLGAARESEFTTVSVMTLDEARYKLKDAKSKLAIFMYQARKRLSKTPA